MIIALILGLELLSLFTMPSVLLRRRGNPISATGWLVALVALPGVTWVAWWIFGRTRLERKTRRHSLAHSRFSGLLRTPSQRHRQTKFERLVPRRALGVDAFSSVNNDAQLLLDGESIFPALEKDVAAAQHYVHLFFFTFEMDETGRRLLDRLIERSRAGVTVRLLVDGLGSQDSQKEIRRRIAETSIEFGVFLPKKLGLVHLPRLNFVNHRKIVVIDDHIAFTGGANVGDEYSKHWRDLMVRFDGPASVGLNHVFLEDWHFATGDVPKTPTAAIVENEGRVGALLVASGPSTEGWIHDAYFAAIATAQRRVWLTTPYLIPTSPLRQALRTAAGRGVDVRIVLPDECDVWVVNWAARPYFRPLLRDGVRLFTYPKMVHGKSLIVDDYCSVGSANLDNRSMELSFEVCCFLDDEKLTAQLTQWVESLMQESHEVTEEQLSNMGKRERLLESLAHLLSPLL